MTEAKNDQKWRTRWLLLNLHHISGIILVVIGLMMWRKAFFGIQDEVLGKIVFAAGLFTTFVSPALFRRHWRKQDAVDP